MRHEYSDQDALFHYGVLGMKWGVRKDGKPQGYQGKKKTPYVKQKTRDQRVTLANGDVLKLEGQPTPRITKFLAKRFKSVRDRVNTGYSYTVKTKDGSEIGDAFMGRRSKDEMYLSWIEIHPDFRGKGYATAIMVGAIKASEKAGASRITLEVPGISPDARHIYEKLGFRDTGKDLGSGQGIWGGLTQMEYIIPKRKGA